MKKTYVIIETKEVTRSIIEASSHTNDEFRKSLDGTLSMLKFNSEYPDIMRGYKKYSHKKILKYLNDNSIEWVEVVE